MEVRRKVLGGHDAEIKKVKGISTVTRKHALAAAKWLRQFTGELGARSRIQPVGLFEGRAYRKGDMVFLEGSRPTGLFCLLEGKVKVFRTSGDGCHQIVRIATRGDLLGYRSILADESYAANAQTLEPSLIGYIDASAMWEALREDPVLSQYMIKRLAQDLGKSEAVIVDLTHKSVRKRLATVLLKMVPNGKREGPLEWKLTREELAEMVGTTPETTIRFLSEFKKAGWITVKGRAIALRDADTLQRIASGGGNT